MGDPSAVNAEVVPADVLAADVGVVSVDLRVEASAYPLQAIFGAAYVFLDRCWVLLDRPDASRIRVTLTRKDGSGGAALSSLVPEFAEELVSAAWRHGIDQETRATIAAATTRAHAGGDAPPSLDDLESYDFAKDGVGGVTSDDPMADPLGLSMSWEEKYKKKDA